MNDVECPFCGELMKYVVIDLGEDVICGWFCDCEQTNAGKLEGIVQEGGHA